MIRDLTGRGLGNLEWPCALAMCFGRMWLFSLFRLSNGLVSRQLVQ